MKKKSLIISMALLLGLSAFAQSDFKEKTVFKNTEVEIRQLDEHTWHGNGHLVYNESVYLVEGDTAAILIDAGTYIPGLRKIVENMVKKPVTLVLTHGHNDHAGLAINEWEKMWISEGDKGMIPANLRDRLQFLKNGQIFDLGNRKIEVVFTPGHTRGSVTFIDRDKHYGFSGDSFGSGNLLVFTDLSTEIKGCESMIPVIEKYDLKYLYPGHYWGNNLETPQRVKDLVTICKGILDGSLKPERGSNMQYVVEKYGVKVNFSNENKK